jgi:UDP-N-acetylmuramate--alanine ligase
MYLQGRHIHFVGIGGVGMSAIAHMALDRGARVSGCDVRESATTRALATRGCPVRVGHDPAHLPGVELVVRSSAVSETDPEIRAAHDQGIPVIGRARMLARLSGPCDVVAVAGAHGKTTTTWIAARLLIEARLDPSVMVGGFVRELGGNYRVGSDPFFVTEVDESDGSLLEFQPRYSIVTNIDLEHVDHYRSLEAIQDTFRRYLAQTRRGGCVIVCSDCEAALQTLDAWNGARLTYGFGQDAMFRAENLRPNGRSSTFDVQRPTAGILRDLTVSLPGKHNVENALAGVALASALSISDTALRSALGQIESVGRRLEVKGTAGGIQVIDDYGHHPTEIRATLEAARHLVEGGRLVAAFQPHRYTRTLHLSDRFGDCFDGLDELVLLPIYGAGEPAIEGVTAERIERAVRGHGRVPCAYYEEWDAARRHLLDVLRPGDTLLTLGAGNVHQLGEQVLADLVERERR